MNQKTCFFANSKAMNPPAFTKKALHNIIGKPTYKFFTPLLFSYCLKQSKAFLYFGASRESDWKRVLT